MISDSQDIWPLRDVIIVSLGCIAAIFVVMRKKSLREVIVLTAASIVLIVINGLIIYVLKPNDQWAWVTLTDLFWWTATLVWMRFNRMAKPSTRRE